MAVYAPRQSGFGMSLALRTTWTGDVALLTDGPSRLSRDQPEELARFKIALREERIARLEGAGGMLDRMIFKKAGPRERRAILRTADSTSNAKACSRPTNTSKPTFPACTLPATPPETCRS